MRLPRRVSRHLLRILPFLAVSCLLAQGNQATQAPQPTTASTSPGPNSAPPDPDAPTRAGKRQKQKKKQDIRLRPGTGEITAGRPRVWTFDRVYPYIDAMARDLDSTRAVAPNPLDANAIQGTSVDLVQSLLRLGGSYDQSIANQNSVALRNQQIQQQNYDTNRANAIRQGRDWDRQHESLLTQQIALRKALTADQQALNQKQAASDALGNDATTDQKAAAAQAVTDAKTKVQNDQDQLTDNQTDLTDLGNRPTIPDPSGGTTVTPGDASNLLQSSALNASNLQSGWGMLPDDVRKSLLSQLGAAASYPASRQLDNFMTLIHERTSQQMRLLADEDMRGNNVYLLEFDIGLYATRSENHKVARVEYTIDGKDTPCSNAHVEQMYPDASAYNISQFNAAMHGWFFAGMLKLLSGIGFAGDYQRLHEQLNNSMLQSIYISGFGTGTNQFGWRFGPSPNEQMVSPGERSVYAYVVVPQACLNTLTKDADGFRTLTLTISKEWHTHDRADLIGAEDWSETNSADPEDVKRNQLSIELPDNTANLKIRQIAYDPAPAIPGSTASGAVLVEMDKDIDPNLVVTVGGNVLQRVRDWRGRATSPASDGDYFTTLDNQKVSVFGLLEADSMKPDTWIAATPRTLLINLSNTTAGGAAFPAIRLHAGSKARDITSDLSHVNAIRMGKIYLEPSSNPTRQAFIPLLYAPGLNPAPTVLADMWSKEDAKDFEVRIAATNSSGDPADLSSESQVYLTNPVREDKYLNSWPMTCRTHERALICSIKRETLLKKCLRTPPDEESSSPDDTSDVECCEAEDHLERAYSVYLVTPGTVVTTVSLDTVVKPPVVLKGLNVTLTPPDPPATGTKPTPLQSCEAASTKISGWKVRLQFDNLKTEVTQIKVGDLSTLVTPQRDPANLPESGTKSNTPVIESGTLTITIPSCELSKVTDNMDLVWPQGDNKSEKLGTLTNLRSVLLPTVTALEEGRVLQGSQFDSVDEIWVNRGQLTTADIGSNAILLGDVSTEGLLSYKIAGQMIPILYKDPAKGLTAPARQLWMEKTTLKAGDPAVYIIQGYPPPPPPAPDKADANANPAGAQQQQTKPGSYSATATVTLNGSPAATAIASGNPASQTEDNSGKQQTNNQQPPAGTPAPAAAAPASTGGSGTTGSSPGPATQPQSPPPPPSNPLVPAPPPISPAEKIHT